MLQYRQQAEYLCEGPAVRSVFTILKSSDSRSPVGGVAAFGGTGAKCFSAFRGPSEADFTFSWFGVKKDFAEDVRMRCRPVFGAYCLLEVRVVDYIAQKHTRLVSANLIELDGQEVVDVVVECTIPSYGVRQGHLFFVPHTWALVGWAHPVSRSAVLQTRIKYEPNTDPPKMKSMDYWEVSDVPPAKHCGQRFDIKLVEFGPIPAKEFTLAALGMKEPAPGTVIGAP